jgi:hypothetical protein
MSRLSLVVAGLLTLGAAAALAQAPGDDSPSAAKPITSGKLRLLAVPEYLYEHVQGSGLKPGWGALVTEVRPDPNTQAVLKKHDILVKFAGQDVRNAAHFQSLLESHPDDRPAAVVVVRQGKPVTLHVNLTPMTAYNSTLPTSPQGHIKPGGPPAVSVEALPLSNDKMKVTFVFYSEGKGKLDRVTCEGSLDQIRAEVLDLNRQNRIPNGVQDLVGVAIDRIKLLNSAPAQRP